MTKTVVAQFTYRDPHSGKQFQVQKRWPCKNALDAEHIMQYHAMKTGATHTNSNIEDSENEETKPTTASIAAKETSQAQCQ